MTHPRGTSTSIRDLLQAFLADLPERRSRRLRIPLAGTLPGFTSWAEDRPPVPAVLMTLRSLGQVIFINNPFSGLLVLLGLGLQSPWMAVYGVVGVLAANLTARRLEVSDHALTKGVFGFNGALVGCAAAAFGDLGSRSGAAAWIPAVAVTAALSSLLLHRCGDWLFRRAALPPLTLPFCVTTWLMLALARILPWTPLAAPVTATPAPSAYLWTDLPSILLQAVPRGFGQVFLCSDLPSGWLVLAAVAVASPLAAGVGLAGALVGALTALAMGEQVQAVAFGLYSYNALLTAIAIGGIFFPLNRRSLAIALLAAAASSLLLPVLQAFLATGSLPALTGPFILTPLASMLLIRRAVPSLIPVAFHSLLTPEEHRQRYRISRGLLAAFRRQLVAAVGGTMGISLLHAADPGLRSRLRQLFTDLDRDGNARLSVAELASGLMIRRAAGRAELASRMRFRELERVLRSMDLDGDGAVDAEEFGELMLRLRQLDRGHDQLMTYLLPVDADANERLEPLELDRLLRSVGQPPLTPAEQHRLYGATGKGMSWSEFIDRLLLT